MQQLQISTREKKPGIDKESENTNRIKMGSAKTSSQKKKASVARPPHQGQKSREEEK